MPKRIVILGSGTGGTMMANRLRRRYEPTRRRSRSSTRTTTTSTSRGSCSCRSAWRTPTRSCARGASSCGAGSTSTRRRSSSVVLEDDVVRLADGTVLAYDVLVVATGAVLRPEETEGMTGPGWNERVFTFYDDPRCGAARPRPRGFDGGRLVVNLVDMPIKCPVAPLEFAFLADWYFTERGVRDKVEITYVTPLDGAFTKPVASQRLAGLLDEKGIELVTEFATGEVDGGQGRLVSWDEREVPFDLLVTVPAPRGRTVRRALGGARETHSGSCRPTPPRCSRSLGPTCSSSATRRTSPISKAGSVTHFEGEALVENIDRFLAGEELSARLRRARELLRRDRLRQGAAHRLQLRDRAAPRSVPERSSARSRSSRSRD